MSGSDNGRRRTLVMAVAALGAAVSVGVGTIAAGIAKAKADVVLISGDSGGTGASGRITPSTGCVAG